MLFFNHNREGFVMRRSVCIICIFFVSLSMSAYASTPSASIKSEKTNLFQGIYLGFQLGNSETHYGISGFETQSGTVDNGSVTSSGFGQRGSLGYQWGRYFAVEAGYTHYGTTNASGLTYSDGNLNKSGDITENSADMALKGILPIANELHFYGKLGAAYIWNHTTVTTGYSKDRSAIRPLFAAGAGYQINQHFIFDISYNHIQSNSDIKSADLIGVGFYYHF